MTSTLRQKRSPLSPNEKLYNKINRRHSIPREKVSSIKKSLKKGEEVDFDFSRIGGEYGSIYTKGAEGRRLLFYKKEKDKMIFLYDAKSLIEDYEKLERFDKFDTANPYVYLHLAIAYWREENDTEKCLCALLVFFRNSPDARGRNVLKTVEDNAWLFIISFEGFALLAQGYLKMGMLGEAAFTYTKFADCMYADENERRFFKSHAYLLLEQYEDAKAGFQKWVRKLEEQKRDNMKSMLQKGKPILAGFEYLNHLKYKCFWAVGMARWKAGRNDEACRAFKNAKELAKQRSPEARLMDYLLGSAGTKGQIESMLFQFSLLNRWRKEAGEKIDLPAKPEALQVIMEEIKKYLPLQDKKTPSGFITDYKVVIKPGPKRKGLLMINNKKIVISSIESDLCVTMANQLKEEWRYINERDSFDVGWVSFEEFERNVSRWDEVTSSAVIINAINRLNKKIRKTLGFKGKEKDLVENGDSCGRSKHYRFRIYPKFVTIK